jgi:hypothetical protein
VKNKGKTMVDFRPEKGFGFAEQLHSVQGMYTEIREMIIPLS